MARPALYEEDILAWSEEQARVLRGLKERGTKLPNEFDLDNVAEEIEGVGLSELNAVASLIEQIFVHLIKAASSPEAPARLHWLEEVIAFHSNMLRRLTPSMRQRIDLDTLWRRARRSTQAVLELRGETLIQGLPSACPLELDDILAEDLAPLDCLHRVEQAAAAARGSTHG
jgi:hypothetical protein